MVPADDGHSGESPAAEPLDLDTVDRLLTTTRSVRKRLDLSRPVPRSVILECLALALQAPSGSNFQLWRWLIIADPDTRSELARLYVERPADRPRVLPPEDGFTPDQRRMMDSVHYLEHHMHEVPILVVPCIQVTAGAAGWGPSIYPAVWSFMLALRSRGLGSCITTSHLYRRNEAAELLGIPHDFAQACLLPVAYFTGDSFRPAHREPVESVTYWDRWPGGHGEQS